jgi:hypothetical protein
MALGKEPTDQTAEAKRPGYVSAVQGRDGRIAAAPRGDKYVRDPRAARAEAIRERVALHKQLKQPIPPHLQEMYDELPDDGHREVELVDEVTGEHIAEVNLQAPPDKVRNPSVTTAQPEGGVSEVAVLREVDEPAEPVVAEPAVESTPEPVVEATVEPAKETEPTNAGEGILEAQAAAIERAAVAEPPAPAAPAPPAPMAPKPGGARPQKRAPRRK